MTALLGLATRLSLAKLMFITDARTATADLERLAAAAFAGGVDIIELRERQAAVALQATALAAVEKQAGRRGLASIYGSAETAAAVRADVVHLSALDGAADQAHAMLGQWALVGRSCHSIAQVDEAVADDAVDFFSVSPVFNSIGVGEAGIELVAHAAAVAPQAGGAKPWFAIGGIGPDTLDQVFAAGARRIGLTRAIAQADDPAAAAAAIRARLDELWRDDPGLQERVFGAF